MRAILRKARGIVLLGLLVCSLFSRKASGDVASVSSGSHGVGVRFGYIDHTGWFVIPPQFELATRFSQNLAAAMQDGKWGYLNGHGAWMIKPQYDWAYPFSEGMATVQMEGKWGNINRAGEWIVKSQFGQNSVASSSGEGNSLGSLMWAPARGKLVVSTQGGQQQLQLQFETKDNFSEALMAVVDLKGKWGYVDHKGQWVIPAQFDAVEEFSGGFAAVDMNGLWGYVNQEGKMVIQPQFKSGGRFSGGVAHVKDSASGKEGYIDKQGSWVVQPQFDEASNFSEGLGLVRMGNRWGYVDYHGEWAVKSIFVHARSFHEGLAWACSSDEQCGYLDEKGQWAIKPQFEYSSQKVREHGISFGNPDFSGGLALVGVRAASR